MSNPAVFRLNKSCIRDNILSIEDNIGESIHFHIGLVRFDLTVSEFDKATHILMNVLNNQITIDNFNLFEQDEYFLERIAIFIPYIIKVENVEVNVNALKYMYEDEFENINEEYIVNTPLYKYYCGEKIKISEYEFKREIWQSKLDFLEDAKQNRNKNIFVNENNFVIDGYKSICAGMALGDIEDKILVRRIICDNKVINAVLRREKKEW